MVIKISKSVVKRPLYVEEWSEFKSVIIMNEKKYMMAPAMVSRMSAATRDGPRLSTGTYPYL